MVKLYLSTPCYGGLCLETYAKGILGLQIALTKIGVELVIDTIENESLVQRARNLSIARFMQKTDADLFMFIDADIDFDPEAVVRLVQSNHDISVACYPKKCVRWNQARAAVENDDPRDMQMLSSSLVVNIGAERSEVKDGFVEVLDGPTGFMMIKRSVLERMQEHYKELDCKNDHQNRDFDDYCALFDCMIDPVSKRYLSEDYAFCRRWQQIGGKIHADVRTTLGHVGNLHFTGCLSERMEALRK
jgi:hypothetical protein